MKTFKEMLPEILFLGVGLVVITLCLCVLAHADEPTLRTFAPQADAVAGSAISFLPTFAEPEPLPLLLSFAPAETVVAKPVDKRPLAYAYKPAEWECGYCEKLAEREAELPVRLVWRTVPDTKFEAYPVIQFPAAISRTGWKYFTGFDIAGFSKRYREVNPEAAR